MAREKQSRGERLLPIEAHNAHAMMPDADNQLSKTSFKMAVMKQALMIMNAASLTFDGPYLS